MIFDFPVYLFASLSAPSIASVPELTKYEHDNDFGRFSDNNLASLVCGC